MQAGRPGVDFDRIMRLVRALGWRFRREGWVPVAVTVLPFVLVLALTVIIGEVGGTSQNGAAGMIAVGQLYGTRSLLVGELLLFLPAFTALFAAFGAVALLRNLIGSEGMRGGVEALLSAPFAPGDIAAALLVVAAAEATALWAAENVAGGATLGIVLLAQHASVRLPAGYLAMGLLLPLLTAWGGTGLAMMVSLLFPRLSVPGRLGLARSGTSITDLLAILPGMGAFLMIVFGLRGLGAPRILLIMGGAVVVIVLGSVVAVARWFRPEAILES